MCNTIDVVVAYGLTHDLQSVVAGTLLNNNYYSNNVEATARESGATAEIATTCKDAKYSSLPSQYTFHPIAIETHGPRNETALDILSDLGRRISACSADDREGFSCFNGFQFACSDLTQFSCTTVFPWMNRIDGHFSYFCTS